jgi:hypothetical protein
MGKPALNGIYDWSFEKKLGLNKPATCSFEKPNVDILLTQ